LWRGAPAGGICAGTVGTLAAPDQEGTNMTDRPPPHPLYRITPETTKPRAPVPPPHDGPDSRSAAVLDGPTALAVALARQQSAREARQERPAASIGPAVFDVELPPPPPREFRRGHGPGDVDDEDGGPW
jgi:hypothetical protein